MNSRVALAALAVAVSLGLVACAGGQEPDARNESGESTDEERLQVVATYSILGDYVENVGGESIELATLVGPDTDAHTFEPTPQDSAEISEADLLFENGLEFETWLDDLYESSDSGAERVVVSEGIDPIPYGAEDHHEDRDEHAHGDGHSHEDEHAHEHEHEHEHHDHAGEESGDEHEGDHGHHGHGDHEHGEYDPHVWLDVSNAVLMVESVRDALVRADPENAGVYEENAREYLAELRELDAWVARESERVPEPERKLVTSHDTFGYFARAYDYEVIGTALSSFTTEAADPSAGETAELVEEIRASGVPAVFAENITNPALMEQVAREADVELAPPLYTDALGEEGTDGEDYVSMMRYNVTTITEALGGGG